MCRPPHCATTYTHIYSHIHTRSLSLTHTRIRARARTHTHTHRTNTRRASTRYAAEAATQVALDAVQCLGGNGYINEYDAGRILRDAKLYEIGAGTSEVRRLIIGEALNKAYR